MLCVWWGECVGHLLLDMALTLGIFFPQHYSVRINSFLFANDYTVERSLSLEMGACVHFSLHLNLIWHRSVSCAHYYKFCDSICVIIPAVPTGLVSFVSFIPSVSYSRSASSFSKFHESWWEGFDEHITFRSVCSKFSHSPHII